MGAGVDERCKAAKRRMRTLRVVILSPCVDDMPGVSQPIEKVLMEACIAEPPIERLDKGVLAWFSGLDVMCPCPLKLGHVLA